MTWNALFFHSVCELVQSTYGCISVFTKANLDKEKWVTSFIIHSRRPETQKGAIGKLHSKRLLDLHKLAEKLYICLINFIFSYIDKDDNATLKSNLCFTKRRN